MLQDSLKLQILMIFPRNTIFWNCLGRKNGMMKIGIAVSPNNDFQFNKLNEMSHTIFSNAWRLQPIRVRHMIFVHVLINLYYVISISWTVWLFSCTMMSIYTLIKVITGWHMLRIKERNINKILNKSLSVGWCNNLMSLLSESVETCYKLVLVFDGVN